MVYCWKSKDLEEIANDLRIRITSGKAVTLNDYVSLARGKSLRELGRFNVWIAKNEKFNLMSYIPLEVLEVLSPKIGEKLYLCEESRDIFEKYAHLGSKNLASLFHTSSKNIICRARRFKIKLKRTDHKFYTPEEEEKIREYYEKGLVDKEIGALLGREAYAIGFRRIKMGLRKLQKKYNWDKHPEAKEFLINNYSLMTYQQMADHLGLQKHQVSEKISNLGLRKQYNWDKHLEVDLFLKENYNLLYHKDIAAKFGLTKNQITARLKYLGLRKSRS
jgi:hypothetical protein